MPKSLRDFASASPKYRASHDASSLRSDIRDLPTRCARGPLPKPYADVAQLAEQLICNQQVIGSSPIIGFVKSLTCHVFHMGGFPSGQRGQTVNLLAMPSKVRILLRPLY